MNLVIYEVDCYICYEFFFFVRYWKKETNLFTNILWLSPTILFLNNLAQIFEFIFKIKKMFLILLIALMIWRLIWFQF